MLCDFCIALDLGAVIEKACKETDFSSQDYNIFGSQFSFAHRTKHDLRRHAFGDCILCRLFWTAFSETDTACQDDLAGEGEGPCALPIKLRLRVQRCHEGYAPVRATCYALEIQKPHHAKNWYKDETWSVFSMEAPEARNPYLMPLRPPAIPQEALWHAWIADCQMTHRECGHSSSYPMPTRLLRIDQAMETIKLVEISGMRVEYVALSYCWGNRASITTTMETYALRLAGIKWSNLPLTFRDAARITRTLGYEYLWIDSLCIIQDSISDWKQECARMQDVYSGAVLTIAADQAEDPYSGLLCSVETEVKHRCEVAVFWPSTMIAESLTLRGPYMPFTESTDLVGRSGPLHTRAWAVQERLLSSRVLHLRGLRSHFECNAGRRFDLLPHLLPSDHGLGGYPQTDIRKDVIRPASEVTRDDWYRLVEYYAKCKLTQGRDRLPALSGLARFCQTTFGCRYLAGIWENDLTIGLAWSCEDQYHVPLSLQPAAKPGPTWSWASCDKPIHYNWATNHVERRVWEPRRNLRETLSQSRDHDTCLSCLDLLSADIVAPAENLFAEVSLGRLSVRGKGRPFRISERLPQSTLDIIYFDAYDFDKPKKDRYWDPTIFLDRPVESLQNRSALLCLVVGIMVNHPPPKQTARRSWYALGLQPVHGQARTYERIGMIFLYEKPHEETNEAWDALLEWLLAGDLGEIHLV